MKILFLILTIALSALAQLPKPGSGSSTGGGSGSTETASNVGGAVEVFKQKTGVDFEFRTLEAAAGASVTQNANTASLGSDDARQVRYQTTAGAPSGTCSPGLDFAVDTTNDNAYFCRDTDTWQLLVKSTGNAATASALAANGTNCSAGNYPLGVDASGNAESCTAVPSGGSSASEYSGTINFGAVPDAGCLESTFTATGATTSMLVELGLPAAFETGLLANAWVSAADTGKVRVCNFSGASVDPASATFKIKSLGSLGLLTGSGTINFGDVPDGSCLASTLTVTGAVAGDHVTAGWPTALETGLIGSMFVSASDTVAVRLCNQSGASVNPASATFKAALVK